MAASDQVGPRADERGLDDLLVFLKESRGFDFSGYKRASLERRIRKRMGEVGIGGYREYLDYLEVTPDEFTDLFNTILINVTGFFRDQPAWDFLAGEVLPELIAQASDEIRVWCAGCSSGEEAYSVAMMLAEALGDDAFRARVKIYATDVDQEALNTARHATYSRDAVKGLPREQLDRFFERVPGGFCFRTDLRRSVIFGRNDLTQDAPISRVDLLVSRNTLMYFTAETQGRILRNFNFALKPTGYLFLGKSEMLITHADLFTPHHLKHRIFVKVVQAGLRERMSFIDGDEAPRLEGVRHAMELAAGALESSPVAQIATDRSGRMTVANQRARSLFGLQPTDIGRPLHELELSFRPAELRSAIERVYEQRSTVELGRFPWASRDGARRVTEIHVVPIVTAGDEIAGAHLVFDDVTAISERDEDARRRQRELETAYDELQSTVEELETTNEELHSTNEELETTNEELQSTNEELETMNEELHSTNDQMEALAEEHRARADEVDRLNLFLEGILGNLGVGVVLVDRDQRVQVWNAASTELWGLRGDEVEGQHFLSLDVGLPVERVAEPIRAALCDGVESTEVVVDAISRRGQPFDCWVRVEPLRRPDGSVHGAILMMADARSPGPPTRPAPERA